MKGTFRTKRRDIIAKTFIYEIISVTTRIIINMMMFFGLKDFPCEICACFNYNTASQFSSPNIFKRNRAHTYICAFFQHESEYEFPWLPWWNVFCYFLIKEFVYTCTHVRRRNVKNEFHFILLSLWECGTGCHYIGFAELVPIIWTCFVWIYA